MMNAECAARVCAIAVAHGRDCPSLELARGHRPSGSVKKPDRVFRIPHSAFIIPPPSAILRRSIL